MRYLILTLFLAFWSQAFTAHANTPNVPQKSDTANGFAPKGWFVETATKGDLNGDKKIDLALIIRKNDPVLIIKNEGLGSDEYNSNPRSVVIAIQQLDGVFLRVAQNDHIIPVIKSATLDDPIDGISVDKNGALTIRKGVLRLNIGFWASAGSWDMFSRTFVFRMQQNDFRLIGFEHRYVHRGSGELQDYSINYLTRRKKLQEGSISDTLLQEQWSRLKRGQLIPFEAVGDGFEFEPQDD